MTLILRGGNLKLTVKTQFPTFKEYIKLGAADIRKFLTTTVEEREARPTCSSSGPCLFVLYLKGL